MSLAHYVEGSCLFKRAEHVAVTSSLIQNKEKGSSVSKSMPRMSQFKSCTAMGISPSDSQLNRQRTFLLKFSYVTTELAACALYLIYKNSTNPLPPADTSFIIKTMHKYLLKYSAIAPVPPPTTMTLIHSTRQLSSQS